jgi:ligand-binding sensor domain-containing protein
MQAADRAALDAARDPRWTQFSQQADGLRSDNIWSIFVDDNGLWFGGEGISRFDGAWTSFALPPATGSEGAGVVQTMVRDDVRSVIWAGTDAGRVLQWDGVRWTPLVELSSAIYALAAVEGEMWVGAAEGLYRFDGSTLDLVDAVGRQPVYALLVDRGAIWVGAQNGLWRFREGRWSQMGRNESHFDAGVYALLVDRAGALVAGTPYGVAWRLREGVAWQWFETVDEAGAPALVQALAEDSQGRIWAGTDGAGAFALRLRDQHMDHAGFTGDPNLSTRFVRDLAVDVDGSVWFATPAGIFRYQGHMWISDVQGEGAEDTRNHINDLLVDRSGVVWVATGGGGVRRKQGADGPESVFTSAEGALDSVLVLAEDSQGALWAGGFDGIRQYAAETWTSPIPDASLPDPVVTTLLAQDAWLWIGTEAGLARYQVTSGKLEEEPTLSGQTVEALALDNLGRLWVGTSTNGIWLREGAAGWRHFVYEATTPGTLPGNKIGGSGLAADPNTAGGMWAIVREQGLVHWDGARWQRVVGAGWLPSNLLWMLYTDPGDGSLWIGSEAGATRYDGVTWGTISTQEGLQSASVYAIARTREGAYWIGGRAGLTCFKPDVTPPWAKLGTLAGSVQTTAEGDAQVTVGADAVIDFMAGDLQTDRTRLAVMMRMLGPDVDPSWQPVTSEYITLHFYRPGAYTLELWARDQSFNYSDPVALRMLAVVPPVEVNVPVLGPVATGPFRALVVLGSIALLGATYVTMEVFKNRRRGLEAVARAYNPYISGEPVRRDDMFFGRRDLVQRIVDTLHNNSIMIYGERRIGKTTLLYQLVTVLREVSDPDYWFVPIYVDLEGTAQDLFFHYLMEEIVEGVAGLDGADTEVTPLLGDLRVHTMPGRAYTDRDFNRDLNRLTGVLEAYGVRHDPAKQLRLIMLMDEMDVMSQYDSLVQQQLRRIFMREFAATLGAVVAGIQISKDWDRVESPWYNLFNEIALAPFAREQAIELLVEPVRGYYRYEAAAIEFVLEHALGRPYKIQQYGLEAVNHMLAQRRRRITLADVEVAHWRIRAAEQEMGNQQPVKRKPLMAEAAAAAPAATALEQSATVLDVLDIDQESER